MKPLMFATPTPVQGRPREVTLSEAQGCRLAEIYLATNRTRKAGSMEAAWVLFCESEGLFLDTVQHHRLVGRLSVAALEWMRRAHGLVVAHRGGAKELRLKGPYQQGGMRTHWEEDRRLRAGESFSVDDLTRNVACWIPWPHGGCDCSENFGVRLGRWQTLVVCDDATFAVPAVSSVFRYASSYQGPDAASLLYQTERHVGMAGFSEGESRWVVEGGVWQSKHALAALADRFYSAKGRPMQKLIERWFGAVQTLDAVWNRDLGRQRGEKLEANQLWLDCRAGKKDPKKFFASFHEGQETLMHAIRYMNEREVRSDLYGRLVPQERWDRDVAERPLVCRSEADAWVMMPERRELKVSRLGMVQCTVIMEDGISRKLVWNAPVLNEWLGRKIELYFDPLAPWPLEGVLVQGRRVIGKAVCQNPYGESRDADRERVASIRRTMLSDLRIILGGNAGARRTVGRGIGGTIEIYSQESRFQNPDSREERGCNPLLHTDFSRSGTDQPTEREKNQRGHTPAVPDLPFPRVAAEIHGEVSRKGSLVEGALALSVDTLSGRNGTQGNDGNHELLSLGRRAAAAREAVPNW